MSISGSARWSRRSVPSSHGVVVPRRGHGGREGPQDVNELSYRILGPLEVLRGSHVVGIRAGKLRCLLATLLVSSNRLVPVDELVERLWGQAPPPTARATLHTYVMRLRRLLAGDDSGSGASTIRPIRTRPEGYLIEVPPEQVDLGLFNQLVAEADRQAHDPSTVLSLLTRALDLWRGPALVDIPSESLQRDVAPQLEERRLHALERRIDAELALGRHAELVGELTGLTTEHRLRERFWQQLMLALYRSRRQAEALDAYARLRAVLVEELGLEPAAETRTLHQRILAEDPELLAVPQSSHLTVTSAVPLAWRAICQLPADLQDFVGREDLIGSVISQLVRSDDSSDAVGVPVVAITGAPGTGKTSVAVRIAHRLRQEFPDGQFFVRLTGSHDSRHGTTGRDPAEVLGELLLATGATRDEVPDDLEARAAAFRARLADRRVLLVLDDAVRAGQVVPLVPGTAGSAVLVTSRRLLPDVPGVVNLRLEPLACDEALALFRRLVRPGRGSDRDGSWDPDAARTIVAACGGLPLAVRIVAARLLTRPAAGLRLLAERLADERRRLDELRVGDLEVRASLALSYAGLSEIGRLALRRLGLIACEEVPAWVVEVVLGEDRRQDAERALEELVQANLVTETGVDATGEPRYRMHDLIGLYALELAQSDDGPGNVETTHRLVGALLQLADAAHRNVPALSFDEAPVDPVEPPRILEPNVVRRLTHDGAAWMCAEQRLLVWAIRQSVDQGWYLEASHLAERVLTTLDLQLPHARVVELFDQVAMAAKAAGDERMAWRATWQRAMQVTTRRVDDAVLDALAQAAEVFHRLADPLDEAYALAALAHFRQQQGEHDVALRHARAAFDAGRASGHRGAYATAAREYASLLAQHGRYEEAWPLFEETLAIARELGGPVDQALVLHRMARHALEQGDLGKAAQAAETSLAVLADVSDHRARAYASSMAARVASARGETDRAVILAEEALDEFTKLGDRFGEVAASASLAEAYLAANRMADVITLMERIAPAFADVGPTTHEERLRNAYERARTALKGSSA